MWPASSRGRGMRGCRSSRSTTFPVRSSSRRSRFRAECVLLFGQEGPGLSPEALAAADAVVEISQFGSTRSINASAAAAVAMHAWILQHVPFV